MNATWANVVLYLHFSYVLFVVLGFVLVVAGAWAKAPRLQGLIRHRPLRFAHLLAIGFVGVEGAFGIVCPLTTLEQALRMSAQSGPGRESFIAYWVGELMFYHAPEWVFTTLYIGLTLLAIMLWFWVPPRRRPKKMT